MLNHLHQPLRFQPKPIAPPPPVDMAGREGICAACGFNVSWVCEHVGCRTCAGQQRKAGIEPLKMFLRSPSFKCPMKKF